MILQYISFMPNDESLFFMGHVEIRSNQQAFFWCFSKGHTQLSGTYVELAMNMERTSGTIYGPSVLHFSATLCHFWEISRCTWTPQ